VRQNLDPVGKYSDEEIEQALREAAFNGKVDYESDSSNLIQPEGIAVNMDGDQDLNIVDLNTLTGDLSIG